MTSDDIFQLVLAVVWSASLMGLSTGLLLAFIGKR